MADRTSNVSLEALFHALDPISLILNQNYSLSKQQPFPLRLTSADSFIMDRGPRYREYAELREKRLRMKSMMEEKEPHEVEQPKFATPPRKQVKFHGDLGFGKTESSVFALSSVPDFSAALRKENRKPVIVNTLTPPSKSFSKNGVFSSSSKGSKSESAGEKKNGKGAVFMARKSYASIHELKSLSSAMAIAINGEGRGGARNSRVIGKTVSGHRQF